MTKAEIIAAGQQDDQKRCFTYCGPDLCNCAAGQMFDCLTFIAPALPVLATVCGKAGWAAGQAKAEEMSLEVRRILTGDQ
jgi:hypothetical protein